MLEPKVPECVGLFYDENSVIIIIMYISLCVWVGVCVHVCVHTSAGHM